MKAFNLVAIFIFLSSCLSAERDDVIEFPTYDVKKYQLIKVVVDSIKGNDYFYILKSNPDICFSVRNWPINGRMAEMYFYKNEKHETYRLYDTLGKIIEERTYYLDSLIKK